VPDDEVVTREPHELAALVEMWKTTIEVQQHFNDLEWKIRGLALTVLTGALGAAALALREGSTLLLGGWRFSLASMVLIAGLLVWLAFFFVDSVWYHRLLVGAVTEGMRIEGEIQKSLPGGGELTKAIGDASPWSFPSRDVRKDGAGPPKPIEPAWFTLHSKHKLIVFYAGLGSILLVLALAAQVSAEAAVADKARLATTTSTVPASSTTSERTTTTSLPPSTTNAPTTSVGP
jgi:hypothetical protein